MSAHHEDDGRGHRDERYHHGKHELEDQTRHDQGEEDRHGQDEDVRREEQPPRFGGEIPSWPNEDRVTDRRAIGEFPSWEDGGSVSDT